MVRSLRSLFAALALLGAGLSARVASADGCYICARGSSDACRDYCQYSGAETWQNRQRCERRGCRIGGTARCPTAVNYRVCMAPVQRAPLAVCDREHPNG